MLNRSLLLRESREFARSCGSDIHPAELSLLVDDVYASAVTFADSGECSELDAHTFAAAAVRERLAAWRPRKPADEIAREGYAAVFTFPRPGQP